MCKVATIPVTILIIFFWIKCREFIWTLVLAFLVKKTSGILIFGPSFRKPARKASSGEIYLKNKDLYATDL